MTSGSVASPCTFMVRHPAWAPRTCDKQRWGRPASGHWSSTRGRTATVVATPIAQLVIENEGPVWDCSASSRTRGMKFAASPTPRFADRCTGMMCRTQRYPNDPHPVRRSWNGALEPRVRSPHQVPDAARRGWTDMAHPLLLRPRRSAPGVRRRAVRTDGDLQPV